MEFNRRASGGLGFSLLEVLVSMAIMVILFTLSVNALVTVTDLSEDVVKVHHDELRSHAFERVFKNGFDSLGRFSRLEFEYVQRDGKYDTYLTITNSPKAFDVAYGQEHRVDHVCLAAEHGADGLLRIGVYYFSDAGYALEKRNEFSGLQDVPYLSLENQAEVFVWNFYDANQDEWFNEITNFTPSLVELKIKRPSSTRSERYVFSIK